MKRIFIFRRRGEKHLPGFGFYLETSEDFVGRKKHLLGKKAVLRFCFGARRKHLLGKIRTHKFCHPHNELSVANAPVPPSTTTARNRQIGFGGTTGTALKSGVLRGLCGVCGWFGMTSGFQLLRPRQRPALLRLCRRKQRISLSRANRDVRTKTFTEKAMFKNTRIFARRVPLPPTIASRMKR